MTLPLPPFKYLYEHWEWSSAPENKKAEVAEAIESRETQKFLDRHPEYYASSFNAQLISVWLDDHGIPSLLWNLEICLNALKSSGLLEIRPSEPQAEVDKRRGIIESKSDSLAEYVTPPAEQAALDKLKDDPNASDATRKARDRKLKLLATRQRIDLKPQNIYR
jgi:hypothetical protein